VTTATVAALLTILGFSLYDTIIVFDRIRENVPRMPRATFSQVVNRSMSEVIVRSLATSLTAGLPVFALLVGGGETLSDFAIALLIGTLSGTYSSVFIASQVLTAWKEREPIYRRRHAVIAAENGGVVPAYADQGRAPGPIDVEPDRPRRRRGRITTPDDPAQGVSREEFDEMVRDLHADAPPARTAVREPEPEPTPEPPAPSEPERAPDADPSELYMKDDATGRKKERKPRNRRHGRNR
jgi:SecD/SecF fusion protein